jgi:hypothetical protein
LINGSSATVDFGALGGGVEVGGLLSGGSLPVFGDSDRDGQLSSAEDSALAMTLNLDDSDYAVMDDQLDQVVNLAGQLVESGIDFIGVNGIGELLITDDQATSLVTAGLAFASDDQATLFIDDEIASGTHLTTSLQDLQKLGVDSVLINGALATVDFGALGSGVGVNGTLSGGGLPIFGYVDDQGLLSADEDAQLTMTLNLGSENISAELDQVVDLAGQLVASGIDLISVDGGQLTITDSQASQLVGAGMAYAAEDQTFAADGEGLAFASDMDVTLNIGEVTGTHLQTSVQELQKLGVDSVIGIGDGSVNIGLGQLLVDASGNSLPSFSSNLDVTLDVGSSYNLLEAGDSVYAALYDKGIDHLAVHTTLDPFFGPDNWLDLDLLSGIYAESKLDFNVLVNGSEYADDSYSIDNNLAGFDLLQGTSVGHYGDLVSALMDSGVAELSIEAGNVEVTDSLAKALIDAGMMQALPDANISLVYQSVEGEPADYLYTSLKDMAELGINQVDVSTATTDKVYIDSGFNVNEPDVLSEIKSLFETLDPQNDTSFFIDGSQLTTKALVLDSSIVTSLIDQSGQFDVGVMAGLEKLGITEIDVLVANGSSLPSSEIMTNDNIAVNLIGQDDELYDFLHNKHS